MLGNIAAIVSAAARLATSFESAASAGAELGREAPRAPDPRRSVRPGRNRQPAATRPQASTAFLPNDAEKKRLRFIATPQPIDFIEHMFV
jgi:hypothetical protein